jgi:hypothetical protein
VDAVVGNGVVVFKPKVTPIESGTGLVTNQPVNMGEYAPAINQQLQAGRAAVEFGNHWVLHCRKAIVHALPTANGVRLTAMLQSARDLLETGNREAIDAFKDAIQAAETLAADPSLSTETKQQLAGVAALMGKSPKAVVESVEDDGRGGLLFKRLLIAIDPEDVRQFIRVLNQPGTR